MQSCNVGSRVADDHCPQVAHVVDEVEYLKPEPGHASVRGWAANQVATTADFSHGSFFWTHFSGGLNYQARRWGAALLWYRNGGGSTEWLSDAPLAARTSGAAVRSILQNRSHDAIGCCVICWQRRTITLSKHVLWSEAVCGSCGHI